MLATFRELLDLYAGMPPGIQLTFGVLALLVGGIVVGIATVVLEDAWHAYRDDDPLETSGAQQKLGMSSSGASRNAAGPERRGEIGTTQLRHGSMESADISESGRSGGLRASGFKTAIEPSPSGLSSIDDPASRRVAPSGGDSGQFHPPASFSQPAAKGLARDKSLYADAAAGDRHARLLKMQNGLDAIRKSTKEHTL